jgi:hypothetical protein
VSIFSCYVRQQPPLAGGSSGGIGTNSSIKIIEKTDTYYVSFRYFRCDTVMSKGADLCQSFTSFGMFKCALLTEG